MATTNAPPRTVSSVDEESSQDLDDDDDNENESVAAVGGSDPDVEVCVFASVCLCVCAFYFDLTLDPHAVRCLRPKGGVYLAVAITVRAFTCHSFAIALQLLALLVIFCLNGRHGCHIPV